MTVCVFVEGYWLAMRVRPFIVQPRLFCGGCLVHAFLRVDLYRCFALFDDFGCVDRVVWSLVDWQWRVDFRVFLMCHRLRVWLTRHCHKYEYFVILISCHDCCFPII